ncbi:MAG TPA: glycerol kinase GlpK [Candidatus Dormibacteraeota bacterium]|nr:glycerol kinase GlpK [Candidatus Dormibacteraeota bacterium]
MTPLILAIDQGTTGSRVLLVDERGKVVAHAYREITQYYPRPGWVEHDAEEIWRTVVECAEELLGGGEAAETPLAAIGITNQRETFLLWDRQTLQPVDHAIVWQCRRSADICRRLKEEGREAMVRERTGLLLDPYFSGTKLKWLLDSDDDIRRRAAAGELAFGTIDTWLVSRLTGGREHLTEPGNASRTLMYDINRRRWDPELLDMLGVPEAVLPEVRDSSGDFGRSDPTAFAGLDLPISGIAGDQQAALFGQACFTPGMAKNTYGTGSFILLNTGGDVRLSQHGMLATVAWQLGGETTYAVEGAIFVTGAALQWLRDGLGIIDSAAEAGPIAAAHPDAGGVYLVPAFTGLGAPYWDPEARGLVAGLTRGSSREDLVRAAVESMAYQTADALEAMAADAVKPTELRVDGGASVMDVLLQLQADLAGIPVVRSASAETTAVGASFLAGLGVGAWGGLEEVAATWQESGRFAPSMPVEERDRRLGGWHQAVRRAVLKADPGPAS